MPEEIKLTVDKEGSDMRADAFISLSLPGISRSAVQKIMENGGVTVNNKTVNKKNKLSEGTEISVVLPDPTEADIAAENIPLDIRYEDSYLLVVNKPKGMVVHPAPGNYSGTLVNALMYYCKDSLSGINGVIRPGIVHRIDKDTSGLLIVAKNDNAHIHLASQIKEHSFEREYRCVVYGKMKEQEGTVDLPIGRHPVDRKKMTVTDKNSRNAVTHYYTEKEYKDFTYLKIRLETGRTHQIRVHMSHIGHPIAGDRVYGPSKYIASLEGQCLHAGLIGFIHPSTGEYIEIKSELPDYFTAFLNKLKE